MIDARYWTAILAASMCGANTGDFASRILGLGHTRGLIPLALIFLAIVWAERRSNVATEAYYWLAIIVLRTMATNIADFATHDLKLSYPVFVLLLIVFMGVMIWADRFRTDTSTQLAAQRATASNAGLPTTDWSYWVVMLAEETVRAVFWFHPAIWWLLGEIGLAREQTVDREVIEMPKSREAYVDALLAIAVQMVEQRDTPALLEHIAAQVTRLLRCERASIFLWDESRHELVGRPALGLPNNDTAKRGISNRGKLEPSR